MVEVRLAGVRVHLESNTPVLLLTETMDPGRTLPIYIAVPEAQAIALALQGIETARPMTHDLLRNVVEEMGAHLERVVVTELRQDEPQSGTFFAELHLRLGGDLHTVSSRPSDAVALAVRTGSPLFVADDLMDDHGVQLAEEDQQDDDVSDGSTPDELVGQFRQFLDTIRPEDFSL